MKPKKIKKVLIANRGEIAVRVIRTLKEMGIQSVAVYSDPDESWPFVRMADEAYGIGGTSANESYLCIDKILEVAKKSGADAIHPGYGFLSERAEFSEACQKNGLIFLGPTPKAILAMGDKVTARGYAEKANVPLVPGTADPIKDIKKIEKLADDFGYPVLLKAAAGGGGKGMRVVNKASELSSAYEQASSEALKSFGDGRVYLEKYVQSPRHVEIQILRDQHGNGVYLFERECSLQRRHQKVIEEAPCPYLNEDVRAKMGESAIRLADQIDYHGVGTVEFLVDLDQKFYFLEMNTRLQVEHCVTEMITGKDLVREQILVAEGHPLNFTQGDLKIHGHAIECRIYAEDPTQNFMPSPGLLKGLSVPSGPGIRNDGGVEEGVEISMYYDPMIAKLICWSETRDLAIEKTRKALDDYHVLGVRNNIEFLKVLLEDEIFRNGDMHTQYIDKTPELLTKTVSEPMPEEVLLAAAAWMHKSQSQFAEPGTVQTESNWWRDGLSDQFARRM